MPTYGEPACPTLSVRLNSQGDGYRWKGDPTDTCLMAVYLGETGVDDAVESWEFRFGETMPSDLRRAVEALDDCGASEEDLAVVRRYAEQMGMELSVREA